MWWWMRKWLLKASLWDIHIVILPAWYSIKHFGIRSLSLIKELLLSSISMACTYSWPANIAILLNYWLHNFVLIVVQGIDRFNRITFSIACCLLSCCVLFFSCNDLLTYWRKLELISNMLLSIEQGILIYYSYFLCGKILISYNYIGEKILLLLLNELFVVDCYLGRSSGYLCRVLLFYILPNYRSLSGLENVLICLLLLVRHTYMSIRQLLLLRFNINTRTRLFLLCLFCINKFIVISLIIHWYILLHWVQIIKEKFRIIHF